MPSGPFDKDDGVRPNTISRVLQAFSNSPNLTFHVREVLLLNIYNSDSVVNARALLCIVGSKLERLTLGDALNNFGDAVDGFEEFFVEALQLCPNLKGLDLVVDRVSQKWWASGGKEELAMAISSLSKLTNLSKAVKNLQLLLYSPPTAEGLNQARALSLFADFDRLQSLNVTFAGFTYMSSAFTRLCNLRHLTMGSMECYDEDVWNNFSEVLRSGDLSRVESFTYYAEDCYAGERETGVFHLLKDGNALKEFKLSLKLTKFGMSTIGYRRNVIQMIDQEARRCYAALEMFASTSKFLKVLHLYGVKITDDERAVTDRIRNARAKNGLGDLHIFIKYRRS
ncbi:hypothetical protein BC829DRAFT_434175 [Chytridium lagenaria]|nr:hypothetical protein BC829DRAFT_434175 [Chytridium lagenaria]